MLSTLKSSMEFGGNFKFFVGQTRGRERAQKPDFLFVTPYPLGL